MKEFKPAADYENLLKQAFSLSHLVTSLEHKANFWQNKAMAQDRQMLMFSKQAIDAEKETNEKLTNYVLELEAKIERNNRMG